MRTQFLHVLPVVGLLITMPAGAQGPLRVLEFRPGARATPGDVFTVTFDRPIVAALEQVFDPARVVRLTPAVAARTEWRDPSTIRVIPLAPLTPGRAYELTIDSAFTAMDGSRLPAPVRFRSQVLGPRLVGSNPRGQPPSVAMVFDPEGTLKLLYSAPVDTGELARVRIELRGEGPCSPRRVPFRVESQRIPEPSERWPLLEYLPQPRDSIADRFMRVVAMRPGEPLPGGCAADLVLPSLDSLDAPEIRYRAQTAMPFRLLGFGCQPNDCLTIRALPLRFSAPVRASDLEAHVRFDPAGAFDPVWQPESGTVWNIPTRLAPRTTYRVTLDSALRDVYERPLTGRRAITISTGDHWPAVGHHPGLITLPADAAPKIRVRHVNVDSAEVILTEVPESQAVDALTRGSPWSQRTWRRGEIVRRMIALPHPLNQTLTSDVAIPELTRRFRGRLVGVQLRIRRVAPGLVQAGALSPAAAIVAARGDTMPTPVALVQSSNFMVHAVAGDAEGAVFVTDVRTGRPVPGASVRLRDPRGVVISNGRTDSTGVTRLRQLRPSAAPRGYPDEDAWYNAYEVPFDGRVIEVRAGGQRTLALVQNGFDGGIRRLDWGFHGTVASIVRPPRVRAVIFTDRDIYRPGEPVYAAAVIREGLLTELRPPRRGSRLRWRVRVNSPFETGWTTVRETVTRLSAYGTGVDSFRVSPRARLGWYLVEAAIEVDGRWRTVTTAQYSVAEYRAPEFLVQLSADSATRFLGDTGRATTTARFLFDAPMGRARVRWRATLAEPHVGELRVRGLPPGFSVGHHMAWWDTRPRPRGRQIAGEDTLDAAGRLVLRVPTDSTDLSTGARITYDVAVEDLNRQTVTATATQFMYGSRFYIAMRDKGTAYWWNTGRVQSIELLAVRPGGERVAGVSVRAALVRLRWMEERPTGRPTGRWYWRSDTVRIDSLVTADSAVTLRVVADEPGYHSVELSALDEAGRLVRASVAKYVMGREGIRWGDSPARLELALSSEEHRSGDTAVVAFVSPFDTAEVWVTAGREQVLWQRRMTVGPGPVTVPIPITDECVPDIRVSVLLVGHGDAVAMDSLHERMRRGEVGIRVDDTPKRLTVSVRTARAEYAPADSATAVIRVTDAAGRAAPGAVAVWAVDEGVLSLTGYERPDLAGWFYAITSPALLFTSTLPSLQSGDPNLLRRMLGYDIFGNPSEMRLSEVVVTGAAAGNPQIVLRGNNSVAMQVPAMVRQDFRSTAFFRAFVTTDGGGSARLTFKLPDNITTFRLIAVALSGGDRFGGGESSLVVTLPLIVRSAMPRFVRPGDELLAGGVVNARDARPRPLHVSASATGLALLGDSVQRLTLSEAGTEARFRWRTTGKDSVHVRLAVDDGAERDAVSVVLPVRPEYSPRAHTLAGVARDSAVVSFVLPREIDPARSHLTVRIGSSPLPTLQVAGRYLRAYPYYCTEQLVSVGRWLVSLLALQEADVAPGHDAGQLRRELQRVVDQLERRQTPFGGFGYWSSESWTSPWLSAHAGLLLLDARDRKARVAPVTIARLREYVGAGLDSMPRMADTTYGTRVERWRWAAVRLADRLAAAHLLHRAGDGRGAGEAVALLPFAQWMAWEDRIWLSHLLQATGRHAEARAFLAEAWERVSLAGARVDIPDSLLSTGLFPSRIRPAARLLSATLAIEPAHPWLGALVERIVQRARGESGFWWNTQDHASASVALAEFARRHQARSSRVIVYSGAPGSGARRLVDLEGRGAALREATIPLDGLVSSNGDSAVVSLRLAVPEGQVYYALTVDEVPRTPPVTPDVRGISVERWYERFDDGRPVTELREGELVRVRLRVTVPGDREFVAIEDPLPAGLEAVDLSLRTSGTLAPFSSAESDSIAREREREAGGRTLYGMWYGGWWSPWEHTEKRDDRVLYFARILWKGTYSASYVARATTSGRFVRPPAHAEEMYNPALNGRSDGGWFRVAERRDR